MGLSFILKQLVSASSLQAFAAGAALSATSLGTTFTVLSTTNLIATRLGTVTTSAAMLDDVVGFVMVQIISNLGGSADSFNVVAVIRPVFVSIGFAVSLYLLCAFCLMPILKKVLALKNKMPKFMGTMPFAFLAQTCVLVGIVASATYAGTSSLFAAYLAGVIISWFDGLVAESRVQATATQSGSGTSQDLVLNPEEGDTHKKCRRSTERMSPNALPAIQQTSSHDKVPTGKLVYEKYYRECVNRIFIPLFFVSLFPLFTENCTNISRHRLVFRFPSRKCSRQVSCGAVSSMLF